jgi:hypothetical protein
MFNDIIKESAEVNIPELISESFAELRFKQAQILMEMTDYSVLSALSSSNGFLKEDAIQPAEKKNFIKRMVDFFRKMIAKIKDFLDKKFKFTDNRLNRMQKFLRAVDHNSIEIETYSNINSFDSILRLLQKSSEELKGYRLNQLLDTFGSMGIVEKTIKAGKAVATGGKSLSGEVAGYVPSLSKYNNTDTANIKEQVLGVKKMMRGIQVDKFYDNFMIAQKFKDELDQWSSEYSKILDKLNLATTVTDSTNMLGPNPQHIFSSIVSQLTAFFNRNIHLIVTLIIEITNVTVSAASQMVVKARSQGMKAKLAPEPK